MIFYSLCSYFILKQQERNTILLYSDNCTCLNQSWPLKFLVPPRHLRVFMHKLQMPNHNSKLEPRHLSPSSRRSTPRSSVQQTYWVLRRSRSLANCSIWTGLCRTSKAPTQRCGFVRATSRCCWSTSLRFLSSRSLDLQWSPSHSRCF